MTARCTCCGAAFYLSTSAELQLLCRRCFLSFEALASRVNEKGA